MSELNRRFLASARIEGFCSLNASKLRERELRARERGEQIEGLFDVNSKMKSNSC